MTKFYDCEHVLQRSVIGGKSIVCCRTCLAYADAPWIALNAVNDGLGVTDTFWRWQRYAAWVKGMAPAEVYGA